MPQEAQALAGLIKFLAQIFGLNPNDPLTMLGLTMAMIIVFGLIAGLMLMAIIKSCLSKIMLIVFLILLIVGFFFFGPH